MKLIRYIFSKLSLCKYKSEGDLYVDAVGNLWVYTHFTDLPDWDKGHLLYVRLWKDYDFHYTQLEQNKLGWWRKSHVLLHTHYQLPEYMELKQ